MIPIEVASKVELAIFDYSKKMNPNDKEGQERSYATICLGLKSEFIKLLLQDFPETIKELQDLDILD